MADNAVIGTQIKAIQLPVISRELLQISQFQLFEY
jgi:hypothetical protein